MNIYRIIPARQLSWRVQRKKEGAWFWRTMTSFKWEFDIPLEFVTEKDAEEWIDRAIVRDKENERVRLQDVIHMKTKPRVYPA